MAAVAAPPPRSGRPTIASYREIVPGKPRPPVLAHLAEQDEEELSKERWSDCHMMMMMKLDEVTTAVGDVPVQDALFINISQ